MRCTSCKSGEMEESRTTYFAQLKDCYVIIENVPCLKCGQCGDVVFRGSAAEKNWWYFRWFRKNCQQNLYHWLLESRIIFNLFRNGISWRFYPARFRHPRRLYHTARGPELRYCSKSDMQTRFVWQIWGDEQRCKRAFFFSMQHKIKRAPILSTLLPADDRTWTWVKRTQRASKYWLFRKLWQILWQKCRHLIF